MVAIEMSVTRSLFQHALPVSRLGIEHVSLEEFRTAVNHTPSNQKEYTLIIVTNCEDDSTFDSHRRILLGQKHRGFGQGMYNSFGGKLEAGETKAAGAVRELREETGITVSNLQSMEEASVGTLYFTFDDSSTEMVVYLFRINIKFASDSRASTKDPLVATVMMKDPSEIRGCEEIIPVWFEDWRDIPLDNMFADDSVWLTNLLSSGSPLLIDGWFHFRAGGQESNSMSHYFLDQRHKKSVPFPTSTTEQWPRTTRSYQKRAVSRCSNASFTNSTMKK